MPKIHVANVLYGQTETAPRVRRWVYRGKDLYSSYNTAQVFTGQEVIINGEIKDFRAPYTFLSSYHVNAVEYRKQLQSKMDKLNPLKSRAALPGLGGIFKGISLTSAPVIIMIIMCFSMFYYFKGSEVPAIINVANAEPSKIVEKIPVTKAHGLSEQKQNFIDRLLTEYRPRLAALISSSDTGQKYALIQFYKGSTMVEELDIDSLHSLGVGVIVTKYGVDLITGSATYPVTSWAVFKSKSTTKKENKET